MNTLGTFNASFAGLPVLPAPGLLDDEILYYHVRTIAPALLSNVATVFYWVDENGVPQTTPLSVLLSSVTQSASGSIPMRRGATSPLYLSATLIGLGTFDVLWSAYGI